MSDFSREQVDILTEHWGKPAARLASMAKLVAMVCVAATALFAALTTGVNLLRETAAHDVLSANPLVLNLLLGGIIGAALGVLAGAVVHRLFAWRSDQATMRLLGANRQLQGEIARGEDVLSSYNAILEGKLDDLRRHDLSHEAFVVWKDEQFAWLDGQIEYWKGLIAENEALQKEAERLLDEARDTLARAKVVRTQQL